MKAKTLFFVLLMFAASEAAFAQYHIQFDAEADRVMSLGGDTLRGNWCTRAEAEAAWNSLDGFARNHSSIVGSDCPKENPPNNPSAPPSSPSTQGGSGGNTTTNSRETESAAERERARQKALESAVLDLKAHLKGGGSTANSGKRSDGLKTGDGRAKDEVAQARAEFETLSPMTVVNLKERIIERQVPTNAWSDAIRRSLKIKAPPLPDKMFSQLEPGDVLLVAPEDKMTTGAFWTGHYIRLFDKLSSWEWDSYVSHTCIYLKEVKGVRFFLDNIPGEGPRIKNEDEIINEYGDRDIDVARSRKTGVAQPIKKLDAEKLWDAARELGIKQLASDLDNLGNYVKRKMNWTNYGLYGNDNMVCSEASRFVLLRAGLHIPDTNSPFKKLLGIYFGPANFYSSEQYFLITPLGSLQNMPDK